jgi:hypothetical protein
MRFVVLWHQTPPNYPRRDHWDFMLEVDGMLRTWALEAEPSPGQPIQAEAISDHRIEYLTYEGPISGGRGCVARWDAGTYETLEQSGSLWRVRLTGAKLHGEVRLEQIEAQRWLLSCGDTAIEG